MLVFPLTVLLVRVSLLALIPPPSSSLVFPLIVLPVIVKVPAKIPPPSPLPVTRFPLIVTFSKTTTSSA